MKVIDFLDADKIDFALSDISVIYQTPAWEVFGSKNDRKGRALNGFLLIDKGECVYEWEGGNAELKHGGLIYLATGSRKMVTVTKRPFSFYRICFTMTELDSGESVIFDEKPWCVTENASKNLFSICEEMVTSTLSRTAVFRSTALMYDFFYLLIKQIKPVGLSRISPALEYIESHYTEEFGISELAEMCYLCEAQLFSLFKKEIGISPIKYKNHLRIEQAKLLIASGECSNREIAEMLGFENIHYFSRVFKMHTGFSPSQYKREESKI